MSNQKSIKEYLQNWLNVLLSDIIEKHGLEDFFKENELANEITPQQEKKMTHFSDKKLQAMWQRAEKAGFTGLLCLSLWLNITIFYIFKINISFCLT